MATNNVKDTDMWETPRWLVRQLEDLLGVTFVHDICATAENAKCPSYWTEDDDALSQDWHSKMLMLRRELANYNIQTPAFWLNPPYSNVTPWLEMAIEAANLGVLVVAVLNDDRSTLWYQNLMENQAHTVLVPDKRIKFEGRNGKGNNKPQIIPVYGPWMLGKTHEVRFKVEPKKYA